MLIRCQRAYGFRVKFDYTLSEWSKLEAKEEEKMEELVVTEEIGGNSGGNDKKAIKV